jgi:hypothetical protein
VFYYNNGVAWRNGRTYSPCVIYHSDSKRWEMWFSGGSGTIAGVNQGIGYAVSTS